MAQVERTRRCECGHGRDWHGPDGDGWCRHSVYMAGSWFTCGCEEHKPARKKVRAS